MNALELKAYPVNRNAYLIIDWEAYFPESEINDENKWIRLLSYEMDHGHPDVSIHDLDCLLVMLDLVGKVIDMETLNVMNEIDRNMYDLMMQASEPDETLLTRFYRDQLRVLYQIALKWKY